MLEHLLAGQQITRLRKVDFARETRVMSVRHQPVAAGVVLLGLERRVAVLEPDFQLLQFRQRTLGNEDPDTL